MQNWKQAAADAIVTHAAVLTDPQGAADDQTAAALRERIATGTLSPRDAEFAQSLLNGFSRYGSFTEKQRPHARRLAESAETPVESKDAPLARALEAALPYVAQKDLSFAQSLLNGFKRFGSFTDRQRPFAQTFANCFPASIERAPFEAPKAPEKPQAKRFPNICSKVNLGMFARFKVGSLALSLKNDGSVIWVKWDDRIVGSIDSASHELRTTRRYATQYAIDKAVIELERVEQDPLAAARENGVLTGRCSCCGRPLTDPTSISYGIGPICRERGFGIVL